MATNGVILINLGNRNAAIFDRIYVQDSYEKASGALEAGTLVTVYKWLYQGFMMGPSICNAVAETGHINLVDKTNGGILEIYPDDTISLVGSSSPAVINPLVVNNNGVYSAQPGVDGYSPVTVNVEGGDPPVINPLVVNENGVYSAPSGTDGYSPITVNVASGEPVTTPLNVNSNGSYYPSEGVDGFSSVVVQVPAPQPSIQSKTITVNGTYEVPSGVDGFNPVVVQVPTPQPSIQSKTITANGTYEVPSGVDGFNPIVVQVPATAPYSIPHNSSGVFFDDEGAYTNLINFYYAVHTDGNGTVSKGASQMIWRPSSYTLGEVYTGYSQQGSLVTIPFDLIYVNKTQIDATYSIWDYVVIPRVNAYLFRMNGNINSPDESYYVPSGKPFGIRAEGSSRSNYGWLMLRA